MTEQEATDTVDKLLRVDCEFRRVKRRNQNAFELVCYDGTKYQIMMTRIAEASAPGARAT